MNTNVSSYQTKICLIDEESGDPTDKMRLVTVTTVEDYDGILIEVEGVLNNVGMGMELRHPDDDGKKVSIQICSDIDGKSILVNIYQPEANDTGLPVSSTILR